MQTALFGLERKPISEFISVQAGRIGLELSKDFRNCLMGEKALSF